MGLVGYVCLRGAHFRAGARPMAAIRGGRVYDVDSKAAGAGVLLGSRLSHARQVCPDLAAVAYDPSVYDSCADVLSTRLRRHTNRFQYDAPDSLFIDFTGTGEPLGILRELLRDFCGFEIVAALAATRFAARATVMALLAEERYDSHPMYLPRPQVQGVIYDRSGPAAANGKGIPVSTPYLRLFDLAGGPEGGRSLLDSLPVGYLWPIPEDRRERLYRLGIKSCGALSQVGRRQLTRIFGPDGGLIADLARGVDHSRVIPSYMPDEIVRRVDFDGPIANKMVLRHSIRALGQDLGQALAGEGLVCGAIHLKVQLEEGEVAIEDRRFARPLGAQGTTGDILTTMLDSIQIGGAVVGIEVSVTEIDQGSGRQLSFLPKAIGETAPGNLLRTVSSLERRFPGGVVRLGTPPVSRRERMLALVDPMRWSEREVPAG